MNNSGHNDIAEVKNAIIDTIKLLIYKENPALLEKVDFNDDNVFTEPLLYAYFNGKRDFLFSQSLLVEILQGYFKDLKNPEFNYSYNRKGVAYLPKLGYYEDGEKKGDILKVQEFEILKEIHPVLERYFFQFYKGHIVNREPVHNPAWETSYNQLEMALIILKHHTPDFYEELVFANKKIYLHDNTKILNFTSIETLGMLFLYITGSHNLVYFIEELVHQGSHNYFYYQIYRKDEIFKISSATPMRELGGSEWDYRDLYGAFHGLYTVCRRVECFDILISQNAFKGAEKHELLARMADQFTRFRTGLEKLDHNSVFTREGSALYTSLDQRCASTLEKYRNLQNLFNLKNRDLDLRYDEFLKDNTIHDFYLLEAKGAFNY